MCIFMYAHMYIYMCVFVFMNVLYAFICLYGGTYNLDMVLGCYLHKKKLP